MANFNRPYSPEIVGHIREFLETEQTNGTPREYLVKIDGQQIFPKTANLEMFETYQSFLTPGTHSVSFIIYKGGSRHNDKFTLAYSTPNAAEQSLNGLDREEEFAERLARHDNENELLELREINGKLREKLRKKKKKISRLEETILEIQSNRYKLGKLNLGGLSSIALEGVVRRNTHWFRAMPGASALAGVIEADNQRLVGGSTEENPEAEASFSREDDKNQDESISLDAEQQFDLNTGKAIRQAFSTQEEHAKAIGILKLLSHRKDLMDDVLEMLQAEVPS